MKHLIIGFSVLLGSFAHAGDYDMPSSTSCRSTVRAEGVLENGRKFSLQASAKNAVFFPATETLLCQYEVARATIDFDQISPYGLLQVDDYGGPRLFANLVLANGAKARLRVSEDRATGRVWFDLSVLRGWSAADLYSPISSMSATGATLMVSTDTVIVPVVPFEF